MLTLNLYLNTKVNCDTMNSVYLSFPVSGKYKVQGKVQLTVNGLRLLSLLGVDKFGIFDYLEYWE